MAIHPSNTKLLVAAGGKWGTIGIWDVKDGKSPTHGVQLFQVCIINVTINRLNRLTNNSISGYPYLLNMYFFFIT